MKSNFPIEAIAAIDQVLEYGRDKGYPSGGWRTESHESHLYKGIHHLIRHIMGFTGEPHLLCGLCRIAMAVATLDPDAEENAVEFDKLSAAEWVDEIIPPAPTLEVGVSPEAEHDSGEQCQRLADLSNIGNGYISLVRSQKREVDLPWSGTHGVTDTEGGLHK